MDTQDTEIQAVVDFAVSAHKGQFRKGSRLPYITHPMAVLSQIADWEIGCITTWKAALLHDVLEDCPVTKQDIVDLAGREVADIVEELTFIPESGNMPSHIQKKRYMQSFANKSVQALVIKVSDRMCNTRDFVSTDRDYAPKYWKKAEYLFDAMITRSEEIINVYGAGAFPRMQYNRTGLNSMLVR